MDGGGGGGEGEGGEGGEGEGEGEGGEGGGRVGQCWVLEELQCSMSIGGVFEGACILSPGECLQAKGSEWIRLALSRR